MLNQNNSRSDSSSNGSFNDEDLSLRKEADVNPDMIAWARLTAGLTCAAVLNKIPELTADTLASFEKGSGKPTWSVLQRFALVFNRPISVFFLEQPPVASRRSAISVSIRYDDGTNESFPLTGEEAIL